MTESTAAPITAPAETPGAGDSARPAAARTPAAGAEAGPETLARAVGVSRRYGDVLALDELSLDIRSGELVGLLGPNGAGKSTLINLFVGLRRPSSGRVELLGGSPADPARRLSIGVTPQETGLPPTLRVREVVDFVAAHFPRSVERGALLERFGLSGLERRQIGGLSGGQKRRLAVALAFVGDPRMVFLDEPTTGLDVEARRSLWEAIRHFHAEGGTVVLTSHYLEEVEALAERVVVIGRGRVLADGSTAEVRDIAGVRRVTMTADDLPDLPGVLGTERDGDRIHLLTSDADALVRALVRAEARFSGLEVRPTSLEEAFLTITARESPAA
ncbi:ABC transporter ATP-binding protein [Planomonospora venezuelensis]|uniref:ABC-2 type transport system ATP-binding protein n=1 Tax=Planomonospora venezuelensis TaxID=1999 RepID=A0A841D6R3_PLAVE|nr:ABC transporter ATP-binding protein [Planomonospora venezuelensis]MBB5964167.1 ABC-2 type transport system ATP-binding protein [Planomonospora venezuelensis]GIN05361.1 ABC transporter ATP-binding protein [Planomonospora venezuelensis]